MVTPGITIRDRLRVLLPEDPSNYYRARDIVPAADIEQLRQARIRITNFHAFLQRDRNPASKTTKELLALGVRVITTVAILSACVKDSAITSEAAGDLLGDMIDLHGRRLPRLGPGDFH